MGQGPEPGGWEAGWACRGNPGGGVHTAVGAEEGTCCTRTAWKAGFAENHRTKRSSTEREDFELTTTTRNYYYYYYYYHYYY